MKRRDFILTTSCLIGSWSISSLSCSGFRNKRVRFGIITDLHYADKNPVNGNNRYYPESLDKLAECVQVMNEQYVDFLIELGDFKDQAEPPDEKSTLEYLAAIENEFSRFKGPYFHVLGNHDHDGISKQQFLNGISNRGFHEAVNYYSFNLKGFHFIVLDANYSSNGKEYDHGNYDWKDAFIPDKQKDWLIKDLAENKNPAVVFIHHRLDCDEENSEYCPINAAEIRDIFEKSGQVILVVQGHYHEGDLTRMNDIVYYTLKAAVVGHGPANNNYAIIEINPELDMNIKGFRNTKSQNLSRHD